MISYEVYKLLHIAGVFLMLFSVGGILLHIINGGNKEDNKLRRTLMISHGIGLLITLVAGFGLLARLGIHRPPLWVWIKFAIWIYFGLVTWYAYKKPKFTHWLWYKSLILAIIAMSIAILKPF